MPAPRTWITAELVTATEMNELRDQLIALADARGLVFPLGDFAGAPLTTGTKAYLFLPYGFRVSEWSLLADQTGSIQLDVRVCAYADFDGSTHPASGDSIAGSEKPAIVSDIKAQDSTLSTWTTDIAAGSVIAVAVESTSGVIKQATLTIKGAALDLVD